MLEANAAAGLKEFCESLHPSTVAETLSEDFTVEQAWRVLEQTSARSRPYFALEGGEFASASPRFLSCRSRR